MSVDNMTKETGFIDILTSVRALAVCSAMLSCLSAQPVLAESEQLLELEKFAVTGTHIQRTDIEGTLPVVVLNRGSQSTLPILY